MKRIRTWAWPEPNTVRDQLIRGSWGGAYWKQVLRRKQEAAAAASVRRVMLIPLLHAQAAQDGPAAPPAAPVVH